MTPTAYGEPDMTECDNLQYLANFLRRPWSNDAI